MKSMTGRGELIGSLAQTKPAFVVRSGGGSLYLSDPTKFDTAETVSKAAIFGSMEEANDHRYRLCRGNWDVVRVHVDRKTNEFRFFAQLKRSPARKE
jgi:hypothetical protein